MAASDLFGFTGEESPAHQGFSGNYPAGGSAGDDSAAPLAHRVRPHTLEEVAGQQHVLAEDGMIGRMLAEKKIFSLILWGPPGCGKTTLARLIAEHSGMRFLTLSAVTSGVAELRKVFDVARSHKANGVVTLLFVDEIHRFNRSQQDAFLPVVEDGTVTLIGATTENPSFELNAALLSRCRVVVLRRLETEDLKRLIARAEEETGHALPLQPEALDTLCALADGDGRYLLNLCEELFQWRHAQPDAPDLSPAALLELLRARAPVYDKHQDSHYNLISALHKSVRGSDPDAALYWLARMLDAGEDPHYLLRRLARMANEDIGLADPAAITQVMAAWQAFDALGPPEGELCLAQACVYLASAPKSNALYRAAGAAWKDARQSGSAMPPKHILNAPTGLMKEEGYGSGYQYDHDCPGAFSGQDYFPDSLKRQDYYQPTPRGFEAELSKRMARWRQLRQEHSGSLDESGHKSD